MPAWTLHYITRTQPEMARFLRETAELRRDTNCVNFLVAESHRQPHQMEVTIEFRDTPNQDSWEILRRNHAEAVPAQPAPPGVIIRPNRNGDLFMGMDPAIGQGEVTTFHTYASPGGMSDLLDRMRRELQDAVDRDILQILAAQVQAEPGGWSMTEAEGIIGINPNAVARFQQAHGLPPDGLVGPHTLNEYRQEFLGQFQTALEDPDFTVMTGYERPGYVRAPYLPIEAEPRVSIDDITQRRFGSDRRPLPPPTPPPAEPLEIVIRRTRFERLDEED